MTTNLLAYKSIISSSTKEFYGRKSIYIYKHASMYIINYRIRLAGVLSAMTHNSCDKLRRPCTVVILM